MVIVVVLVIVFAIVAIVQIVIGLLRYRASFTNHPHVGGGGGESWDGATAAPDTSSGYDFSQSNAASDMTPGGGDFGGGGASGSY